MSNDDTPYTETEIRTWPGLGPPALNMWRMLATVKAATERDTIRAQRDAAVEALAEAQDFFMFHADTSATAATATQVNQGDINRLRDSTTAALALAKGGTR